MINAAKAIKLLSALGSVNDLIAVKDYLIKLIQKKQIKETSKYHYFVTTEFIVETSKAYNLITKDEVLTGLSQRLHDLHVNWDKSQIVYTGEVKLKE